MAYKGLFSNFQYQIIIAVDNPWRGFQNDVRTIFLKSRDSILNLILAFQERNFGCIFFYIRTNFSLRQIRQGKKLLFHFDDNC